MTPKTYFSTSTNQPRQEKLPIDGKYLCSIFKYSQSALLTALFIIILPNSFFVILS